MSAESYIRNRRSLSLSGARVLIDAGLSEARELGVSVTIVVVDESGRLKAAERMDGAPLVSIETATNKAYAAAAIGMPPDDFYDAIKADGAAVASFGTRPGLALIAGGLPILTDGAVAGGIGVAGAMTGGEDRQIADKAVSAL